MQHPATEHHPLVEVFRFDNQTPIRIVDQNGEPWFVAKDVCEVLGYTNPRKAVADHCKGGNETLLPSAGGMQTVRIIPERDVYRLIMRSKLPAAEKFENWVVGEVLPSIRKNGRYGADPMQLLNDPATLRTMLLEFDRKVQERDKLIADIFPKAEALDLLSRSQGTLCLTDAAKVCEVSPREFTKRLHAMNWIYKRAGGVSWIAYQDKLKAGLLEVKTVTMTLANGETMLREQTLITPKGMARLAESFNTSLAIH